MTQPWHNFRMFIILAVMTGVIYPALITIFAHFAMHNKANGDLIYIDDRCVGSALIAQNFESSKYFWPRPSAVGFNTLPSGGSNLGPTSKELVKTIEERRTTIIKACGLVRAPVLSIDKVPSELLFASGSGLDPHISPEAAYFQVDRVINARRWDQKKAHIAIENCIKELTQDRFLGVLGMPTVNVLQLNMALDRLEIPTHE